jgi:DNA-binding NarL/FixJ family response regulator
MDRIGLRAVIDNLEFPLTREAFDAFKSQALELLDDGAPAISGDGLHRKLSPREHEVMDMLLSGKRLKEIGAALDISVKTVTTHRARLLRKLQLDDNLGLYRYGVRHGFISV